MSVDPTAFDPVPDMATTLMTETTVRPEDAPPKDIEHTRPKPVLLLGLPQTTNNPMEHVKAIGDELRNDYYVIVWRSPTRKPVIEIHNCPADEKTVEELRARIEELCPAPKKKA